MRRFLLILASLVVVMAQFATLSAQETKGVEARHNQGRNWTFGGKVNIYSGWNGMIGLGAYVRYDLNDALRLEPSLVILCDEEASMDLAVDLHLPFDINPNLELYPLVGLSLNDPGKLGLGVNLGGGLGYRLSHRVVVDYGMKYMVSTQKYINNPLIFTLGCGFKF